MDTIILWICVALSITLFLLSFRKQPIKDWLLSFLLASYFAYIIGTIVVDLNLIEYPILRPSHIFNTGYLYELLFFPIVGVYFYQTSYTSGFKGIIFQCLLYTLALTIVEILIVKYTHLINYLNWNWAYTFCSVFSFMLIIRFLLILINRKNEQSTQR